MNQRSRPHTGWRVLAVLGGLLLGALWLVGSGLALGLRECPPEPTTAGLCESHHATLLAALEAAIVLVGAAVSVAGGLFTAHRGRPGWLLGAVVILAVLGLCADLVLVGQVQPPT